MLRRTPLTRKTPLRNRTELRRTSINSAVDGTILRRKRIKPESRKRATQMRRFRELRDAYLAGHPFCEYPEGCTARAAVVHHKRGRAGERLLDTDWFAASCDFHNDYAETHTGAALACGWLVRIEAAA